MPLRVAFDLDGTIADMNAVLRQNAERLFGDSSLSAPAEPPSDDTAPRDAADGEKVLAELQLTPRQRRALWSHVKRIENFWGGLPETEPGIVARIADIAASRRWDVIFLTTRPAVDGDTTQIQSQRWLRAHGFDLPSVFVVRHSRGRIADALELDAVVDDRPENSLDVALDSKALSLLVWPHDASDAPPGARSLGVQMVPSIAEALDVLIRLDDSKSATGLTRSLKKIFGRESVR